MPKRTKSYTDEIPMLYPELFRDNKDGIKKMVRTVTFQVTDSCNLACTYCYQTNKGKRQMSFDTAKKLVDALLSNDPKLNGYVTPENSPAIIIDFIGGEPFMNIDVIYRICDYFLDKTISMTHPWALLHRFSLCSNGVLYFDKKVQKFLDKYQDSLSLNITLDGNKELHDSCRVFPDGSPSYDLALAATQDWMSRGFYMGSKITIAPANLPYLYDAIIHMVELGYTEIFANTVFEEGWNIEHAIEFYKQLKILADYWIDNDMVDTHYLSLFEEDMFVPQNESDNQNYCGGTGLMLSMDPDGYLFPCIRYMETSLGNNQTPMCIGHIDTGIGIKPCHKNCIDCLNKITRRSQSTDECFYCPIGQGCAWCSAYNYQVFGTADKRATFICDMHKARSLANVYFWNKYYKKNNINKIKVIHCPKEWALNIINIEEYNMLIDISSTEGRN